MSLLHPNLLNRRIWMYPRLNALAAAKAPWCQHREQFFAIGSCPAGLPRTSVAPSHDFDAIRSEPLPRLGLDTWGITRYCDAMARSSIMKVCRYVIVDSLKKAGVTRHHGPSSIRNGRAEESDGAWVLDTCRSHVLLLSLFSETLFDW